MRAVVEQTFTSTATVKRPSGTSDGRGGKTATLTTISSTQACRVALDKDAVERQLGKRTTPVSYYKIYFPVGANVLAKDQITVDGVTYELVDLYHKRTINTSVVATATRLK